jgi:hypothetical protein
MESPSIMTLLKNLSYIATFVASVQYVGLTPESVLILTGFIILDIITGILKSLALYGGQSVRSIKVTSGLLAKLLLLFIPFVIALSGKAIGVDISMLAVSAINILILSQAYSIIGNIYSIQTGKETTEFDAVSFILKQVREVLERMSSGTKKEEIS